MAVIIGSATTVNVIFTSLTVEAGFTSVDWSYSTNIQRLYTLGAAAADCGIEEYAQIRGAEIQISFSIYCGNTPEVSTCAPTTCQNSPCSAVINIVPASCDISLEPINKMVFFNNYSYSKERNKPGVETWQGSAYDSTPVGTLPPNGYIEISPTFVLLGQAEGTLEGEPTDTTASLETLTGARLRTAATPMTSNRGSVQGGNLSFGDYTQTWYSTFQSVGASEMLTETNIGRVAKASVTINTQPYYGTG